MRGSKVDQGHVSARLGTAVNWQIASAVLILGILIYARLVPTRGTQRTGLAQRGAKAPFSSINWKSNDQTLLVAIGPDCAGCKRTAFFKKLISASPLRGVSLVVLAEPPLDQATKMLAEMELEPRQILIVPFAQVGLRTLPALVLVDAGGTVAEVWEGSLDSSREADVMTVLGSRSSHA
jgi:hypothetical protein